MKRYLNDGVLVLPTYKCGCGYRPSLRGLTYLKSKNKYYCNRCGREVDLNKISSEIKFSHYLRREFEKRDEQNKIHI